MNFSIEMLLDRLTNGHRLFRVDEVDGNATFAEPSRATDSMQVGLAVGSSIHVNR